ncbi:2Fe-2S iron-sulfur cluster binding domain-containing protein [bacterium]|nr:2Fe-2S iron-sulfur cluster binding domain-containing protein [bacterium]
MKNNITITINKKKYKVKEGETILQIAKRNNIYIPTLCYHPDLLVKGSCRLCLVEIEGKDKLYTSCSTLAFDGMVVKTNTEKVKKSRKLNLELIFAEHAEKCCDCVNILDCKLLKLAKEFDVKITRFKDRKSNRKTYKLSNAVEIDGTQCIDCQNCIDACQLIAGINHLKFKDKGHNQEIVPKNRTDLIGKPAKEKGFACIYCGQCALHCPVGAAQEQSQIKAVMEKIKNKKKDELIVAQIAPSIRVSIGEEFNIPAGEIVTEQLIASLKKIGFDAVFDVNFGADITTIVEAGELVERIENKGKLPMITSCCPAWVRYVEVYQPELIPNLTTSRSPQIHNAGAIKSYWAKKMNIKPEKITLVSIMPCTAKKYEASRKEFKYKKNNLVNNVLTTRELAYIISKQGIDLKKIKGIKADKCLNSHSGAAAIYGGTGGVMESALRTAKWLLENKKLNRKLDFKEVRGLQGVKETSITISGVKLNLAVVSGMANAQKLLKNLNKYHYIEIMACPGGCIGGGGQPIPTDDEIRKKRIEALYSIDKKKTFRQAHENKEVEELLKWFKENKLDHKLLHTSYSKKNK